MRKAIKTLVLVCLVFSMAACATMGGAVVGGGIGAIAGDARTGAQIGATIGAIRDIWG